MLELIRPQWPAPESVVAVSTTRQGGHSEWPYDSLNLGHHVGDAGAAVEENRKALLKNVEGLASLQWLEQVHGTRAIEAGQSRERTGAGQGAADSAPAETADAQWSRTPGVGCAILTADCLPVLFCTRGGDAVAAAHAGWRGLQAGVLEQTLEALAAPREAVMAWLGPAIGPAAFEVGEEVREAFLRTGDGAQRRAVSACFLSSARDSQKFYADLYGLARIKLRMAGVTQVYGGGECTFTSAKRYFSYRRDGVTGRMASVIGIRVSHK